jgi:hypothetical protein
MEKMTRASVRLINISLAVLAVLAAFPAKSAATVTAQLARSKAIEYFKSHGRSIDLFDVVVDPDVMTYPELLDRSHQLAALKVERCKKALSGHHFWWVHFVVKQDPDRVVGGGGTMVFVDAKSGNVLFIRDFH